VPQSFNDSIFAVQFIIVRIDVLRIIWKELPLEKSFKLSERSRLYTYSAF